MDSKKEIRIFDRLGKAIRYFVSLSEPTPDKALIESIRLFEAVVKQDNRNELLVPDLEGCLPKGIRAKHLALACIAGLYKRLGDINKHQAYIKRTIYFENKYSAK